MAQTIAITKIATKEIHIVWKSSQTGSHLLGVRISKFVSYFVILVSIIVCCVCICLFFPFGICSGMLNPVYILLNEATDNSTKSKCPFQSLICPHSIWCNSTNTNTNTSQTNTNTSQIQYKYMSNKYKWIVCRADTSNTISLWSITSSYNDMLFLEGQKPWLLIWEQKMFREMLNKLTSWKPNSCKCKFWLLSWKIGSRNYVPCQRC